MHEPLLPPLHRGGNRGRVLPTPQAIRDSKPLTALFPKGMPAPCPSLCSQPELGPHAGGGGEGAEVRPWMVEGRSTYQRPSAASWGRGRGGGVSGLEPRASHVQVPLGAEDTSLCSVRQRLPPPLSRSALHMAVSSTLSVSATAPGLSPSCSPRGHQHFQAWDADGSHFLLANQHELETGQEKGPLEVTGGG